MTPRKALTQHPIYQELLDIGRRQKTIRPDAFAADSHLLASPEVRRRCDINPTDAELQHAASEALHDAINHIVSLQTRAVAEAALCSSKRYEGKQITERIHEMPGMTIDIFRYQREHAFEEIVQFLTREVVAAKPHQSDTGRRSGHTSATARVEDELTLLVDHAASLHYAGLAVLFVETFDAELRAKDIPLGRHAPRGSFPLTTYFLEVILRFTYCVYGNATTKEAITDADVVLADRFLKSCSHFVHFQNFPGTKLAALWHKAAYATPLSPSKVKKEDKKAFRAGGWGDLSYVSSDVIHGLEYWLHSTAARKEMGKGSDRLAEVISAAGLLAQVLNRQIAITEPVFSKARRSAEKAIATCYGFDDWAPVAGGKSLRDRALSCLDSGGMTLTGLQD